MAIPVLTAGEMQEIDRQTIEQIGIAGAVLMEQAGKACAEEAEARLGGDGPGRLAVICGRGNNGGDGFVAARHLLHAGHQVDVFLIGEVDQLKGDALLNKVILDRLGMPVHSLATDEAVGSLDLSGYQLVLDGLLGTGLNSEVKGRFATVIDKINAADAVVVAIDLPSGLSADTGRVLGCAVRAEATVTFGAPKRGQLLFPGADLVGDLTVADIGFPPALFPGGPGSTWLMTEEDLEPYLTLRRPDAHKGHFGHLLVVAGSEDKPGAAGLCCRAACRSGAGLVTLAGSPEVLARVLLGAVEFMGVAIGSAESLVAAAKGKTALAIGPGLGRDERAAQWVREAVSQLELPVIVDADGLNLLVGQLDLLTRAPAERILTPHPGEMARLLACSTAEVQASRFESCRELAARTKAVVVLKGAGTVVADPDGTAFLIPTGNPGMASGGSGDVLTGMIGALIGQGLSSLEAACVGAFLHGAAGDFCAGRVGQRSLIASDLIDALPEVFSRLEGFRTDLERE